MALDPLVSMERCRMEGRPLSVLVRDEVVLVTMDYTLEPFRRFGSARGVLDHPRYWNLFARQKVRENFII